MTIAESTVTFTEATANLRAIFATIHDIGAAARLLDVEQEVSMPPGAVGSRSAILSTLESQRHGLLVSQTTRELIERAEQDLRIQGVYDDPDCDDAALVRACRREYDMAVAMPASLVTEIARVRSLAGAAFGKAKQNDDFALFKPYLNQIIELSRAKAKALGYKEHPYDALLNQFDPGMTVAILEPLFAELQERLTALLSRIQKSKTKLDKGILRGDFDLDGQWRYISGLLPELGFDNDHALAYRCSHSFSEGVASPFDVRMTAQIKENELDYGILASIHECGHSLFELGVDPGFARTPLASIPSTGLHESQSLLMERMVALSLDFWSYQFPRLQAHFPEQLSGIDAEQFYAALNSVKPGTIRLRSNEVAYNLHIILRYRLEKALIEGSLAVDDLPDAWSDLSNELLGLRPESHKDGVLQDVHWAGFAVGYFPTYTIGGVLAAQFFMCASSDLPGLRAGILKGDYSSLREWLRVNIHRHGGKYSSASLVERVTGDALSVEPYLNYLESKYSALYKLQ